MELHGCMTESEAVRAAALRERAGVVETPHEAAPEPAKHLSQMNRAELDAVLASEDVDRGEADTNKAIVEVIRDAREAREHVAE